MAYTTKRLSASSRTETYPHTVDCSPDDFDVGSLRPIGQIMVKVVGDVALRAASYWLVRADEEDGEGRIACLETAGTILRTAGLRWGDFVPRKAA